MRSLPRFGTLLFFAGVLGCAHGTVQVVSPVALERLSAPVGNVTVALAPPGRYAFKLSGAEDQFFRYSSSARLRSLARCLGTVLANHIVSGGSGAADPPN